MLINCKKCGVLFQKKFRSICDACVEAEKNNVETVEVYAEKINETFISMESISSGTGIDLTEIIELYKNGRLAKIACRISVNCSICGAEIKGITKKGHFCIKCYDNLKKEKTKTPVKPSEEEYTPRKFDKNIVHTKKVIPQNEKMKYGFKKRTTED